MLSELASAAVAAAAVELDVDPEVLQVPVDHAERAVVIAATPESADLPALVVIKAETDTERAHAERRMLGLLAGRTLADRGVVPDVLFASDGPPLVTGLSHIGGDPLDRGGEGAWRRAGQALRVIHDLEPTGWTQHRSHPAAINDWIDQIGSHPKATELGGPFTPSALKEFRRITESLVDDNAATCVLHGDFSTEHVLVRGDQVLGVIDFGDAGLGDPAHDIAVLTLWHPEQLDLVLAGYQAEPELEASIRSRITLHRMVRLAAGALWLHEHDFDPAPLVVTLYEHLLN